MHHNEHLRKLESHYRACACRSTTPFFSERKYGREKNTSSHTTDEEDRDYRTYFQHDRDKILYSRSFKRLRLKTQILPEHIADYLRTRSDHTLEVSQIARHLARQLRLNEDLVDAIALAHDIGHTPFAHSGERALHKFLIMNKCDGFKHNWQGLRVVDKLEEAYPEINGVKSDKSGKAWYLETHQP
jgi:dGTPase